MRPEEVFAERLRAARQAAGLSQYALGVLAGIDEGTAKVRINQYENRKHIPSLSIMERLADALDKPAAWFVCAPDELGILETLHSLNATVRAQAVRDVSDVLGRYAADQRPLASDGKDAGGQDL